MLRQYGTADENDMLLAFQQYQIRVSMLGIMAFNNADMLSTHSFQTTRHSNPSIMKVLRLISNALATLNSEMLDVENDSRDVLNSAVDLVQTSTLSLNPDFNSDKQPTTDSLQDIKTYLQDTMRQEFSSFRSQMSLLPLLQSSSPSIKSGLNHDIGNMKDFLQSFGQNGWIFDVEIWEIIWDVVETLDFFILAISSASHSAGKHVELDNTVGVEMSEKSWVVYFTLITDIIWNSLGNRKGRRR